MEDHGYIMLYSWLYSWLLYIYIATSATSYQQLGDSSKHNSDLPDLPDLPPVNALWHQSCALATVVWSPGQMLPLLVRGLMNLLTRQYHLFWRFNPDLGPPKSMPPGNGSVGWIFRTI